MTEPLPIAGHPAWESAPESQGTSNATPNKFALEAVDCADYIASFTPPDYLIDGIVISGMLYSLTAMTGHLKTALATLFALSAACGKDIAGREVTKCKVLLLSGENDEDQKARTIATMQEYGFAPEPGYFRVISGAQGIGSMLADIESIFDEHGPFGLVIVDTSIAYFSGEEENDNKDQQTHAGFFREITQFDGKPSVVVLCHPIKSATKDNLIPRGGGAFLAAVDGNLTLYRQAERATLHWQGKYRGASFEPVEFGMKLVQLDNMRDSKGRPINSVVIKPMNEQDVLKAAQQEWTDENKMLHEMLHHPNASYADWAELCGWVDKNGMPIKSKVSRVIDVLAENKLVEKDIRGKKWILSKPGKQEALEVERSTRHGNT